VNQADCDIARKAENAAYATSAVVMVDVVGVRPTADGTAAALRGEQLVERLERQPVFPLEVTLPVGDLLLAGLGVIALSRLVLSLGIVALPKRRALYRRPWVLAVLRSACGKIAALALQSSRVPAAR
jgi:hypothetical protein